MEQRVVKIKKGSSIANMLPFTPTDERKISWEKQSRLIKQWTEIEVRVFLSYSPAAAIQFGLY